MALNLCLQPSKHGSSALVLNLFTFTQARHGKMDITNVQRHASRRNPKRQLVPNHLPSPSHNQSLDQRIQPYPTPSKPRYAPTNTRNYDLKIGTDKGGLTNRPRQNGRSRCRADDCVWIAVGTGWCLLLLFWRGCEEVINFLGLCTYPSSLRLFLRLPQDQFLRGYSTLQSHQFSS